MQKLFITAAVAAMISGSAFAQEANLPVLSGEVSIDLAETTNDNYGATMGLELGINAGDLATVDLNFTAVDGGAVTLDTWTVGTTVAGADIALGDDNGVMPGAEGEQTLTAPAMAESVQVTMGGAAVAVGFDNWTTDVTDISNVQGAYTFSVNNLALTVAADHNLNTDNNVLGAGVAGLELGLATLGGAMSYDVDAEVFGFEAVATTGGLTAYLNGTDSNTLQNVGGEYVYNYNGMELSAGANYNVDTEDFAPTVGVAFAF